MFPKLWIIPGKFFIMSYAILSVAAMFASMIVVRSEARRLGWSVRNASLLVLACTGLGFVGAHILFAFTMWHLSWDRWLRLLVNIGFGYVWFGGFLASWGLCQLYARRFKIPMRRMDDVAAFAVLVAQPVGRMGCLLHGCCFGTPTDAPWGILLKTQDFGLTHVHPVMIYEALYLLAVFTVLWALRTRPAHKDGQTAYRYLMLAPLGRFVFEFYRGDSIRGFVGAGLSTSQFISIALFGVGVFYAWMVERKVIR